MAVNAAAMIANGNVSALRAWGAAAIIRHARCDEVKGQGTRHGRPYGPALVAYQQARYLGTGRGQLTARYEGKAVYAGGVTAELRNLMRGNRRPAQAFEGRGWLDDGIFATAQR